MMNGCCHLGGYVWGGVMTSMLAFVLLCAWGGVAGAQQVAGLEPEPERQVTTDWLIDGSPYKAGVYKGRREDEIVLSNGLVRRTFRLAPNCATVALDNLATGESVLRGVKPEAEITIDGQKYEVGGLKGQPNYAYLSPEWADELKADPYSLRFEGFEVGPIAERMQWKQVRHHAPDSQWPPKGVYLRMDYAMPEPVSEGGGEAESAFGRTLLLEDSFASLDGAWRVHASGAHPRSSFENEGKVGEIYTPANTAVYAERDLPDGVTLVEVVIDAGTDKSASWGPGIALVWPDRVVKLALRPGADVSVFGVYDGTREIAEAGGQQRADLDNPCVLRIRLEDGLVYCEAKPHREAWRTLEKVELPEGLGAPKAVRIGKMDGAGGDKDLSHDVGDLVRLRMLRFAAYTLGAGESAVGEARQADSPAEREPDLKVSVHYELYDGVPVMSKWLSIQNGGQRTFTINNFTSEILAAVEYGSAVETRAYNVNTPNIHVETDYAFSSFNAGDANHHAVHWEADPDYSTQVNYQRQTPCLLNVRPDMGPEQKVAPSEVFETFRAFVMPRDSYDRERQGLALRRMYRVVAPWVTENPLMMHVRFADWDAVKLAVDQCADVGFEMVIMTFGSGFDIENESAEYIAKMKEYADYAHGMGVEIGGYSLLASRKISEEHDVVMPEGRRPTFGNSPCLQSEWGRDYFRKLYGFYEQTGQNLLEHDGSYPGDPCMSDKHPGHEGWADSQWKQYGLISDFYKWCRGQGVYLNIPDYYYLAGGSKCGMGYRETNWSLPRAQQVIHTRQNIHDGTWEKTPSMGWMFVPLTVYHGGGAAATIEPLDEHLDHYEMMMISNLAMGAQACYRGPRLYDTERTRDMVKRTVAWYKKYRDILESDMIHGRRADGRDIDWMLHVNPDLKEKGMLVVFNPLDKPVTRAIKPNLYYTGLTDKARIREQEGESKEYALARDYSVELEVTMEPGGFTWFVIE